MARTDRDSIIFAEGAILDYSRTVVDGHVVKFRLQLRVNLQGAMRNILRYDHAHGSSVHRHRCWLPGEPTTAVGPFTTLDHAFVWCVHDLRTSAPRSIAEAERYFTGVVN